MNRIGLCVRTTDDKYTDSYSGPPCIKSYKPESPLSDWPSKSLNFVQIKFEPHSQKRLLTSLACAVFRYP